MRRGSLAIVFRLRDGRKEFLLVKNKRTMRWSFPAGGREFGETAEENAFREVLEETGLRKEFFKSFKRLPFLNEFNSDKGLQVQECFLIEVSSEAEAVAGKGIQEIVWKEAGEAEEILEEGLKKILALSLSREW